MSQQLRIHIPCEQFRYLLIYYISNPLQIEIPCKSPEEFLIILENMMWYNRRGTA